MGEGMEEGMEEGVKEEGRGEGRGGSGREGGEGIEEVLKYIEVWIINGQN